MKRAQRVSITNALIWAAARRGRAAPWNGVRRHGGRHLQCHGRGKYHFCEQYTSQEPLVTILRCGTSVDLSLEPLNPGFGFGISAELIDRLSIGSEGLLARRLDLRL